MGRPKLSKEHKREVRLLWNKTSPKRKEITARYRDNNKLVLKQKGQQYYVENKLDVLDRNKNIRQRDKAKAVEYVNSKKQAACLDCQGFFEPWQMHFDHRDPKTKVLSISAMVGCGHSLPVIQKEIEKCDLVCANCHATRTHNQIQAGVFRG